MWTDTAVRVIPIHDHVERRGSQERGQGGSESPRAPGVFDKKAQPFAIAALEMYHTLCRFQAEESSLASWRGARNFTPEPRLGPRNLLMVSWYKGQGSHPQAEQEVGTDGLERTGEKASCPCVPAGGQAWLHSPHTSSLRTSGVH